MMEVYERIEQIIRETEKEIDKLPLWDWEKKEIFVNLIDIKLRILPELRNKWEEYKKNELYRS